MSTQGYTGWSVSVGSVSAYSFKAFSLSKVNVSPLRLTKAIKSFSASKSETIGTFKAVATFSNVPMVVFPFSAFDSPTREIPIISASSFWVMPLSLQISKILKCAMITICLMFYDYKDTSFLLKVIIKQEKDKKKYANLLVNENL